MCCPLVVWLLRGREVDVVVGVRVLGGRVCVGGRLGFVWEFFGAGF
jgi:hypothetical protein